MKKKRKPFYVVRHYLDDADKDNINIEYFKSFKKAEQCVNQLMQQWFNNWYGCEDMATLQHLLKRFIQFEANRYYIIIVDKVQL